MVSGFFNILKRLVFLGRPSWTAFTYKAQHVCTAADLLADTAKRAGHGLWQEEIHNLIFHGFFEVADLYPSLMSDESEAVQLHVRHLVDLVGRRVQSLAAYYLRPPLRYAGALLREKENETLEQMRAEWQVVLEAEKQAASGQPVPALASMRWRHNSINRLCMLLNERAHLQSSPGHSQASDKSSVLHILRLCSAHLGDTRVVENCHQMTKVPDFKKSVFL